MLRERRVLRVLLAAAWATTTACGLLAPLDDHGGGDVAGGDASSEGAANGDDGAAPGNSVLTFPTPALEIDQGKDKDVPFTVARTGGGTESVTVTTAYGGSDLVVAPTSIVGADQTDGKLHVAVQASARGGPRTIPFLVAVGNAAPLRGSFDVVVGNQPGVLDTSFGDAGVSEQTIGSEVFTDDVVVTRARGAIMVLAHDGAGSVFLARLTDDGALDGTFRSNGVAVVSVPGSQATRLVEAPDGTFFVVGTAMANSTTADAFVAHLDADGNVIGAFGGTGTGVALVDFGQADTGAALALTSESPPRLVVVGTSRPPTNTITVQTCVAALHAGDGSLDKTAFAGAGRRCEPSAADEVAAAYDVAVDPRGGWIVAGTRGSGAFVRRYLSDGTLDATFGSGGSFALGAPVPTGAISSGAFAVDVGAAGVSPPLFVVGDVLPVDGGAKLRSMVAAIDTATPTTAQALVVDGYTTDLGSLGVRRTSTGAFVVAERAGTFRAVSRRRPDGTLDPTFGASAVTPSRLVVNGLALGNFLAAGGIALDHSGKIVVTGFAGSSSAYRVGVARIWN